MEAAATEERHSGDSTQTQVDENLFITVQIPGMVTTPEVGTEVASEALSTMAADTDGLVPQVITAIRLTADHHLRIGNRLRPVRQVLDSESHRLLHRHITGMGGEQGLGHRAGVTSHHSLRMAPMDIRAVLQVMRRTDLNHTSNPQEIRVEVEAGVLISSRALAYSQISLR